MVRANGAKKVTHYRRGAKGLTLGSDIFGRGHGVYAIREGGMASAESKEKIFSPLRYARETQGQIRFCTFGDSLVRPFDRSARERFWISLYNMDQIYVATRVG